MNTRRSMLPGEASLVLVFSEKHLQTQKQKKSNFDQELRTCYCPSSTDIKTSDTGEAETACNRWVGLKWHLFYSLLIRQISRGLSTVAQKVSVSQKWTRLGESVMNKFKKIVHIFSTVENDHKAKALIPL